MPPRPRAASGSRTALQARALPRDRACPRPHRSLQAPILSVAWIPDSFTLPPRLACRPLPCSLPPIPNWQALGAPAGTPAILAEEDWCLRRSRSSPPPAESCTTLRPDEEHCGSCQGTLHAGRYRFFAAAPAAVVVARTARAALSKRHRRTLRTLSLRHVFGARALGAFRFRRRDEIG